MRESEKESVVLSVAVWLLMSTVLSLSSGCRSSLSRPWKLWPLQRGWGQISLSLSHHGPACSERPAPFRFYQPLFSSSSPTSFPCLPFLHSLTTNVWFLLSHTVASSSGRFDDPCCVWGSFAPGWSPNFKPSHPSCLVSVNQSVSLVCHLYVTRHTFPVSTARQICSL